ncbi:MAG: aminotransferase class V-fold PLP-dependent enzyme [Verrucomicrobiota bacterium]
MKSQRLTEILNNEEIRRSEFPVVKNKIFFAHAAVAPLPRSAAQAVQDYAWEATLDFQECGDFFKNLQLTRQLAADLIQARPQDIALIGPTALGLNLVALGISWESGDEVVYYPGDYPSNVYPWSNLETKGVRPVPLKPEQTGVITPELVFSHLTTKTKLVALSSCHYLTGYRLDYEAIGTELKKRGILFCLDSIQSLGASAIDVRYIDFLSADSHKWLLGPIGAGIFYVNPELYDRFHPTLLGSFNVNSPGFVAQDEIHFHSTAQRFEVGTLNGLGIIGMKASLEVIQSIGVDSIYPRLIQLHTYLREKLRSSGWNVLSEAFPENSLTGIVTTTKAETDLNQIYRQLSEAGVVASLRWDKSKKPLLRFSPHFYNTFEEIDRALEVLVK